MQPLSDRYRTQIINTENFEGHDEGWRTLWFAIAGVMTLAWNVLMLSLNGISY